jgi:Pyruvate/2-oxoacid:ferredoxin oxidoreductase gamma subunit
MENPAEESVKDLQNELKEKASEAKDSFLTRIALTTALIAALAAVTGYLAGERADESLVDQIHAADSWSHYQAKSIKSAILSAKTETLQVLKGEPPAKSDTETITRYDEEMKEIQKQAEEQQSKATERLEQRKILANGVTLFQIAIAIGAISAITRKQALWYGSLIFGAAGLVQLLHELLF